jgi:hypothetical protein
VQLPALDDLEIDISGSELATGSPRGGRRAADDVAARVDLGPDSETRDAGPSVPRQRRVHQSLDHRPFTSAAGVYLSSDASHRRAQSHGANRRAFSMSVAVIAVSVAGPGYFA